MFRVFANDKNSTAPADDFTFLAHWFYRCSYLHIIVVFVLLALWLSHKE